MKQQKQKWILAGTLTLALNQGLLAQPPGTPPSMFGPPPMGMGQPGYADEPGPEAVLPPPPGMRSIRRRELSWIYIDPPKPRKLAVHDIITIIVDEKDELVQNKRFNRQRNIVFNAQLQEFIRLNDNGNLAPAAENQPAINGSLRSQMQSYGQGIDQQGIKYRIAATIVDVLPNGTLILEARKTIRSNTELWEYSLTGRIRAQDIAANNTAVSENIADLNIVKTDHGKFQDSTKRGYITRLYDFLLPF
jgi:flagellar L-ring protein precursor FlgH